MPCHVPLPRSIAARCANPAPPAVRPPRRRCCRRPPRSSPTHRHFPTTVCPRQRTTMECKLQLSTSFIPFQLSTEQLRKSLQTFSVSFHFGSKLSMSQCLNVSQCPASRYSKPSAILRMPAVLTIRTKPKLFPICVRTCRNLSKTS